jgi:hypothetical protein
MKKIALFVILLLFTTFSEAQIFRTGGINGMGGGRGRLGGGGSSGFGSDQKTKIFLGAVSIAKANVKVDPNVPEGDGSASLSFTAKYFLGATYKKFLFTGNFEANLSAGVDAASDNGFSGLNTRYYLEAAYPIFGSFSNRGILLAGFLGAGATRTNLGVIIDDGQEKDAGKQTDFYMPLGAYLNLDVLPFWGLRLGYAASYNSAEQLKNNFDTEGFMFGSYFKF